MENRKPLTDANGEIRELGEADFNSAIPFSALSESLRNKLSADGKRKFEKVIIPFSALQESLRNKPSADGKRKSGKVPIPLSRDIVEHFQASGKGWQAALREWLKIHSAG